MRTLINGPQPKKTKDFSKQQMRIKDIENAIFDGQKTDRVLNQKSLSNNNPFCVEPLRERQMNAPQYKSQTCIQIDHASTIQPGDAIKPGQIDLCQLEMAHKANQKEAQIRDPERINRKMEKINA